MKDSGFYHIDHEEGYDPYHVEVSGIWEGDSLCVSDNFIAYGTVSSGPLRTIFELNFAPWSNYQVKETKWEGNGLMSSTKTDIELIEGSVK